MSAAAKSTAPAIDSPEAARQVLAQARAYLARNHAQSTGKEIIRNLSVALEAQLEKAGG